MRPRATSRSGARESGASSPSRAARKADCTRRSIRPPVARMRGRRRQPPGRQQASPGGWHSPGPREGTTEAGGGCSSDASSAGARPHGGGRPRSGSPARARALRGPRHSRRLADPRSRSTKLPGHEGRCERGTAGPGPGGIQRSAIHALQEFTCGEDGTSPVHGDPGRPSRDTWHGRPPRTRETCHRRDLAGRPPDAAGHGRFARRGATLPRPMTESLDR